MIDVAERAMFTTISAKSEAFGSLRFDVCEKVCLPAHSVESTFPVDPWGARGRFCKLLTQLALSCRRD
jgi:hypothetical protein